MTAIVFLLFIIVVPIDCKIANFFLILVCLLGKNYNIGELTSTKNIIFTGATPINESSYASIDHR